jgi:hypothetical protein
MKYMSSVLQETTKYSSVQIDECINEEFYYGISEVSRM